MHHRGGAANHGEFQPRRGILRRPQRIQADLEHEQGEGSLLQKCLRRGNRAPSPHSAPAPFTPLATAGQAEHTDVRKPLEDGKVSQLEHVFIRGSRVRFMIIPDMLKNAPMLKRLEARIIRGARGQPSGSAAGAMRASPAAGDRGGGPPVGGGRGGAPPVRR